MLFNSLWWPPCWRLFCNCLTQIHATNNKKYLKYSYTHILCVHVRKKSRARAQAVEILNKFLHISCLPLFLLLLLLLLFFILYFCALLLQLDTVFTVTPIYLQCQRGEERVREKPIFREAMAAEPWAFVAAAAAAASHEKPPHSYEICMQFSAQRK